MSMIPCWTYEESAKIIETLYMYENKPVDIIKGQLRNDHIGRLTDVLTTIPNINKTDAITLMSQFGSFKNILFSNRDELCKCAGIGDKKRKILLKTFIELFDQSLAE
eukprot:GHVR01015107.1.p1 GENE.GHVR01015107.1~~GHVR01015107.1.p1  ORF type:complete len:107 (-),score=16.96 GHVR01015107.1:61-381(-)